jgi:hypothetical protein
MPQRTEEESRSFLDGTKTDRRESDEAVGEIGDGNRA